MVSQTPSATSDEGRGEQLIWTDDERDANTEASTPSAQDQQAHLTVEDASPTPLWLLESSDSSRWRFIPQRQRRLGRKIVNWTAGPQPPYRYRISPWFPSVQQACMSFIDKCLPRRPSKIALLGAFYASWLLTFSLLLHHSAKAGDIEGYGKPDNIWCGASFWSANNACGLDGNRCRPFDNATFTFRCPANCDAMHITNPRVVGDLEVNFKPFVIGGPVPREENSTLPKYMYRGDSFICQAAVHSGIVSSSQGGCGVALLSGEHSDFAATKRHGIESLPFDSSFPKSFTFISSLSSNCVRDLRWPLLAVTCAFTVVLSLCTASAPVLFFSTFVMLFFHVGLVSDPPNYSSYPSLISVIVGRFLPAMFVAVAFYRYSVKPQQSELTANIERTVLWLGGAWIGALNNHTFAWIPIERLTPDDIHAQAGAVLALVIIVLIYFVIALQQAWFLRQEGRLRKYLAIYVVMAIGLLICVAIPQLQLRLHHYFVAILLIPGTRTQTRPSLLYQGILLGLFINGAARWGFDSILQTAAELRGPDGQQGSLLPNITTPIIGISNVTFGWSRPPAPYDGISILVNDVERHKWFYGEGPPGYTMERSDQNERKYFRFAYMQGSDTGDYTKAGIWEKNGSWTGADLES